MFRFFYSFLFCKFYLLIFIECSDTDNNLVKSFIKFPDEKSYSLGVSVTLTCRLKIIEMTKIVVFRKEKSMKSEGCNVFDKNRYDMECTDEKEGDYLIKTFKFTIKQLSWEDRGKWECFYAQNIKSINLDITVKPIFDKLQVNVVFPVSQDKDKSDPNPQPHLYTLMGRGSRTNPYNLRNGATVNITCFSACSYPETVHRWVYQNTSHSPVEIKSIDQKKRDLCNLDSNKGMTAAQSDVIINCSTLKMVGANIVMCSSGSDSKNSSVYILCPGGERPWELTTGEIIGVAVSIGIFVILVFFLYFLIKKSMYTSVPGDASTNTYSSGVKL